MYTITYTARVAGHEVHRVTLSGRSESDVRDVLRYLMVLNTEGTFYVSHIFLSTDSGWSMPWASEFALYASPLVPFDLTPLGAETVTL
jgi:hypothetical protein